MDQRLIDEVMRLQLPPPEAFDVANVVNIPNANRNGFAGNLGNGNGDGGGDGDGDGDGDNDVDAGEAAWQRQLNEVQLQAMRLENAQVAMLLDAPQEPPIELHQHQLQQLQHPPNMLEPMNVPQRPRKKRSFWTISKPFPASTERCALIASGLRAVQCAQPEQRSEYFANYLFEHLNSDNFPNGEGLPNRWGQF